MHGYLLDYTLNVNVHTSFMWVKGMRKRSPNECIKMIFEYVHMWLFVFLCVQFQANQEKMNFATIRNIQGLHAPLKLQMEYRAARQVESQPTHRSSSVYS